MHHLLVERDGGLDALDHELAQRPLHADDRLPPVPPLHDQLADQAVVGGRDGVAGVDVGVHPHAGPARRVRSWVTVPGEGAKLAGGILGVDAALDGVALPSATSSWLEVAASRPAAMRICSLTRSMPVTISVTGCSTWMRVFISMK